MALTVGTNAYETLANVRAFWAERGDTAWASLTDAAAEVLIIKATDYVDRTWEYIGTKATGTQRLKWPRTDAEVEGFALSETEVPRYVEEATAEIAELYRLGTYDLQGIVTNDAAALTKQKVDVIEVEYDAAKRLQGGAVPSHVYEILRPVIIGNSGGLKRA
jgi:hypothetical protein